MASFLKREPVGLDFKEVLYVKDGWTARITLHRPQNYNAYSTEALRELTRAFEDASWDDRIAVVVFTGEGERAFCTGGDVKEYHARYTRRPRDYGCGLSRPGSA